MHPFDSIFDFGTIYIICLFISYASPLTLFSSPFPYLSPYLSFPLRTDPLRFQAGCCRRRLNLALVFCVYFVEDFFFLQCFDTVGWVAGRASGL